MHDDAEARSGLLYGVAAYLLWGMFPLYWPLLEPAGAIEILAHRMVWSLAVVTLVLAATGDRETNRRIGQLAREQGRLAGVADRQEECSVYFPALITTESVTVGMTSEGRCTRELAAVAAKVRRILNEENSDCQPGQPPGGYTGAADGEENPGGGA